jgi:hypothetical protein
VVDGDLAIGGYRIFSQIRGGWWYGTDQYLEVIRIKLGQLRLW